MSTILNTQFALAIAVVAAALSMTASTSAFAGLDDNCRIVIRSTKLGGNYFRCTPKGTMNCVNNRCTISKLPPPSRTAGRPAKR